MANALLLKLLVQFVDPDEFKVSKKSITHQVIKKYTHHWDIFKSILNAAPDCQKSSPSYKFSSLNFDSEKYL